MSRNMCKLHNKKIYLNFCMHCLFLFRKTLLWTWLSDEGNLSKSIVQKLSKKAIEEGGWVSDTSEARDTLANTGRSLS